MTRKDDILKTTEDFSPKERAAAIAHWIYSKTAERDDSAWTLRVADAWRDLDPNAREFNLASIETWVSYPEIFEAWVEAIKSCK